MVRTTVVNTRRRHREPNPKPVADNVFLWDYSQECNICHSSTPALDIKNYDLVTPLNWYEYMRMLLSYKYNLKALTIGGWVYI
jgi:hypothetical protein